MSNNNSVENSDLNKTKPDEDDNKKFINKFLKLCVITELYSRQTHWNTKHFSTHKATDEFISSLLNLQDTFVEAYAGHYGIRPNIDNLNIDDEVINKYIYSDSDDIIKKYTLFKKAIEKLCENKSEKLPSQLSNIKDELISAFDKLLYLLTLN